MLYQEKSGNPDLLFCELSIFNVQMRRIVLLAVLPRVLTSNGHFEGPKGRDQ
jgi:hypothetical protein